MIKKYFNLFLELCDNKIEKDENKIQDKKRKYKGFFFMKLIIK